MDFLSVDLRNGSSPEMDFLCALRNSESENNDIKNMKYKL
jgi:hypothetical protein